jgi:hypothetical protein
MITLLGRASNNERATARLLLALAYFWDIKKIGEANGTVIVEYNNRWAFLNDNGGEINLGYINENDLRSVPTTTNRGTLTAEVVAYRIAMTLKGEPVDYDYFDIPGVPVIVNPLVLLNS